MGESSSGLRPALGLLRALRRSLARAMTSEMRKRMTIGTAMKVIVNGSADGVATAAKTKMPTMIHGRCAPRLLPGHDAREVEHHHEDGDLEGEPEDQQGAGEELEVLVEVDEVGDALGVEADEHLEALGQRDVAQQRRRRGTAARRRARRSATTCARWRAGRAG